MKKISVFAGLMAAAAVSLTNCTVQDAPESAGRSFSIIADLGQTRTTNEGTSTLWAENDAVNVFHAAPGSSNYVSDGKFTVSEGAKTSCATFTGETSADVASGASFDWYALYPYNEKHTTPASSSSEGWYTYIGHSKGIDQPVYDDMSKLTGTHCPLYGKAEGVTGVPGIAFKHLSSVIEFKVVNNTGGVLVVKSLDLEASEDIVGSYYIDFTGDEPVYVPSSDNYVNSKATVNITTPAELATGAAAKIYMPVKPYTQSASKSFKVTVSGTVDGVSGEAVVELNPVGAQAVFTAGKIKTVTVPVGPMAEVAGPTFVFNTEEAVTKWGLAIPANGEGTSVNGMTFTSADGIGLTFDKASASTDCRIFSHTNTGALDLRVYKNSKMTFTAPSGYSVSRIEFAGGSVTGAATSNPEGYSRGVWEGKSSTVIITPGATMNIDTITVTLETGEVAGPEEPEVPGNAKGTGTLADPFNAAGAMAYIDAGGDDVVYVKGIISKIQSAFSVSYGTAIFWISDDGVYANDYSKDFEAYSIYFLENKSWLEGNTQIKLGDEVVLCGKLTKYNDTYETASKQAYVYSLNGVTENTGGTVTPEPELADFTSSFDFSAQGYENGKEIAEVSFDDITIVFDKGSNSNSPKYYTSGTAVRVYGGNSFTVTAKGKTITAIAFVYGSGESNDNKIDANSGTFTSPNWTGSAQSIVFTIGGTSGHRRIKTIAVKYE